MFFSTQRILQAVALHYGMEERLFCSRIPNGAKAKEAQIVLGRLLYRYGETVKGEWSEVGRVTRAGSPNDCMFGAEPYSYRLIIEELERQPELLLEEAIQAPEHLPPSPTPESIRVPEGVSGRRNNRPPRHPQQLTEREAPKPHSPQHPLEATLMETEMAERVILAAGRMEKALVEGASLSIHELRPGKQRAIFEDTATFLRAIANKDPWFDDHWRAGRIGAPPRTGKTVIAGQIIAASQMVSTFVVPSKTLIRQAERDLQRQLPGVPIGVYFSEEKRLVKYGVNITTYSMVANLFSEHGCLPQEMRDSSLIFVDEGHRSMSKARQRALRDGFHKDAVRIAMTGSEDFNERRQLRRHFPFKIHKITIAEALELKMFANTRVYVAEVDISASTVEMIAGDLDQEGLSKIMSSAPFFEAARVYRYYGENRDKQALICCSGRNQAQELLEYLKEQRPEGTPEPVLILADTANREDLLEAYAEGKIDTLINVGVLIEGWNAPKCKILIDLAPTCSLVRATQKYFRPMTVWEDHEARIYVLLPKDLRAVPVLPMDLFGFDRREYEQGELIAAAEDRRRDRAEPSKRPEMPSLIHKVKLASRFLFQGIFALPELDPEDDEQIREVLLSCPEVTEERVPKYSSFMRTVFKHPLFTGLGQSLLSFLGISVSLKQGKWDYLEFVGRYFPEAAYQLWADRNYCGELIRDGGDSCERDRWYLMREARSAPESWTQAQTFADCWRAVASGGYVLQGEAKQHNFDKRFLWEVLKKKMKVLEPRERRVIELRFGLFGESAEFTLDEVAEVFDLTRERIRQIETQAIRKLRVGQENNPLWNFWKYGI